MGGTAKKNLRIFREICGDEILDHVRIVTTNWNLVDEKQGNSRQDALAKGVFEPIIKGIAPLCRHDKGLESAKSIMGQLIHQPPVMMKIQEELDEGRTLGDTSAGAMIIEEMKELKEKHDKEIEGLRKEMEEALRTNDEELRLELDEERQKLEEMMTRAEEDRKTLEKVRKPREAQFMLDAARKIISDQMPVRRDNEVSEGHQEAQGGREVRDQARALLLAGTVIGVGVVVAPVPVVATLIFVGALHCDHARDGTS
jgi:hypothetical protein